MLWLENGQGTWVDLDQAARLEFDAMGVRVFVPGAAGLHAVAGGSQEAARGLRARVSAGGPWVRVRADEARGDGEAFANISAAVVVEFLQSEAGPVARIITRGGALAGEAHLPDAVKRVREWVATETR